MTWQEGWGTPGRTSLLPWGHGLFWRPFSGTPSGLPCFAHQPLYRVGPRLSFLEDFSPQFQGCSTPTVFTDTPSAMSPQFMPRAKLSHLSSRTAWMSLHVIIIGFVKKLIRDCMLIATSIKQRYEEIVIISSFPLQFL